MYVIGIKKPKNNESYSGSLWDKAGLRQRYKSTYDELNEASYLAYMLSFYTDDKFHVYRV